MSLISDMQMRDTQLEVSDRSEIGKNCFGILFRRSVYLSFAASALLLCLSSRVGDIDLFPLSFTPESFLFPAINQAYRPFILISNTTCLIFSILYYKKVVVNYKFYIQERRDFVIRCWPLVAICYLLRIVGIYAFSHGINHAAYDPAIVKAAPLVLPLFFSTINISLLAFFLPVTTAMWNNTESLHVDHR